MAGGDLEGHKQPIESGKSTDNTEAALNKRFTEETDRSVVSGSDKVAKMPEAVQKALGLSSSNEVQAYVADLQRDDKVGSVLQKVAEKGKEASLSSKDQDDLMKAVKDAMTPQQHAEELDKTLARFSKLSGVQFNMSGDLTPEAAKSLMSRMSQTIEDLGKKA